MEKVLRKLSKLLGRDAAQDLSRRLRRVQEMPGANSLFKRIATAPDKDQLDDYLAEIRYALVFAGLGFQVKIEPEGKSGPDLGISRNSHYAVVEVMRFRKVSPGTPTLDATSDAGALLEYGNPQHDIAKAFDKVRHKFRQVRNDESIIAIWNDDEDLEEVEVQTAIRDIHDEETQGIRPTPNGLLFVLYGSNWIRSNGQQLACFPIHDSGQQHQRLWQQELQSFTVKKPVRQALAQLHDAPWSP